MLETLFGGLLGGIFRIAPEVLKWLDRKGEREHELKMLNAEMEFAKIRGEIAMRQTEAQMTVAEMDAITAAVQEQGATARAAGWFVAAISALVRPVVTWWWVILYSAYKVATYLLAMEQQGDWKVVASTLWGPDDMAILMMILTFWFVGRVWERSKR